MPKWLAASLGKFFESGSQNGLIEIVVSSPLDLRLLDQQKENAVLRGEHRQARIVGIVDVATRENLLLKTRPSIRSCDLVKELEWLFLVHGKPKKIRFDNGREFRSQKLTEFLKQQGVEAGFIKPGSPWQNGHIESFFGKLRDELLNMEIFLTGKDLQSHLDDFQEFYNNRRPHSALGGLSPAIYKANLKTKMEAEALTP